MTGMTYGKSITTVSLPCRTFYTFKSKVQYLDKHDSCESFRDVFSISEQRKEAGNFGCIKFLHITVPYK